VTTEMVSQCSLLLPVTSDGAPDFARQVAIADRLAHLRRGKERILSGLRQLASSKVTVAGVEAV
jgi:hypothetical protein